MTANDGKRHLRDDEGLHLTAYDGVILKNDKIPLGSYKMPEKALNKRICEIPWREREFLKNTVLKACIKIKKFEQDDNSKGIFYEKDPDGNFHAVHRRRQ